jgi:uncharacterized protein
MEPTRQGFTDSPQTRGTVASVKAGDSVLLRSVYGGRVRWAFPHRFVANDGDGLVLYLAPGTRGVWMGRGPDGRYLERWARGDDPSPHVWHTHHILFLARRDETHMLGLLWDESWRFRCWYVNLQAPFRESPLGYDYTDWALDVVVAPDGTWAWKDEGDFAEAQELGILDVETAAAIRAEGERVIAERPWPTGWEDWRADPAWTPLSLPGGWAHV